MATNQIIRSANSAVLIFNNKPLGTLQTVRFDMDYGVQEQYAIGGIDPVENVPTAGRYTVTAALLTLLTDNLVKNGIVPSSSADMLTGLVFDVLLMAKENGQVLQKAVGCTFSSGSTDVSTNRVITSNVTFKAMSIIRL